MNLRRLTGIAGILYPLLTLQTVLGIFPHPEAPTNMGSDEARAFIVQHYWVLQGQTWFHITGVLFFGAFVVGLTTMLRERAGAGNPWLRLATFSGAGMVTLKVAALATLSGFFSVHERLDGALVMAINDALWYTQSMTAYFGLFLFGGLAAAILSTRSLPSWAGWTAAIVAALSFCASLLILSPSMGFAPFPVLMLTLLWSLVVGVYLAASSRAAMPTPPQETGATERTPQA